MSHEVAVPAPSAVTVTAKVVVQAPVKEWKAGEVHRALLQAAHRKGVARKREARAALCCEKVNPVFAGLLWGMAEAVLKVKEGKKTRVGDYLSDPVNQVLRLARIRDGRWVARERASEASVLARNGEYSREVVSLADRLSRLIEETVPEDRELRAAYGARLTAEDEVVRLEDELRRARCRGWKRALEAAAASGWITFAGTAAVAVVKTITTEVPIGAAPGGAGAAAGGSHLFLLIPLGVAVMASVGLALVKRTLRRR